MGLKGAGSGDDTTLYFGVDASDLNKASREISKFGGSAKGLSADIKQSDRAAQGLADEIAKIKGGEQFDKARRAAAEMEREVKGAKRAVGGLGSEGAAAEKSFSKLGGVIGGVTIGIAAVGAAAVAAASSMIDLSESIFEATKRGSELATGDALLESLGSGADDVERLGRALNGAFDSRLLGDVQLMGLQMNLSSEAIRDLASAAKTASVTTGADFMASFKFAAKAALDGKSSVAKLGISTRALTASLSEMGKTFKTATPDEMAAAMREVQDATIGADKSLFEATDSVLRLESRVDSFRHTLHQQLFELVKNEGFIIRIEAAMDALGVVIEENEPLLRSLAKNGIEVLVLSLEGMAAAMQATIDLFAKVERGVIGIQSAIPNAMRTVRKGLGKEYESFGDSFGDMIRSGSDELAWMDNELLQVSGSVNRLVVQQRSINEGLEKQLAREKVIADRLKAAQKGAKASAQDYTDQIRMIRLEFGIFAESAIPKAQQAIIDLANTVQANRSALAILRGAAGGAGAQETEEFGTAATSQAAGSIAGSVLGESAQIAQSTVSINEWHDAIAEGNAEWQSFAQSLGDSVDPVTQSLLLIAEGFEKASIAALEAATPAEGAIAASRAFANATIKDKKRLAAFLVPVEIAAAAASYPDWVGIAKHGFAATKYALVAGSSAGGSSRSAASRPSPASSSAASSARTVGPASRSVVGGMSGIAATETHFHIHAIDTRTGADRVTEMLNNAARRNNGAKIDGRILSSGRTRRRGF